MGNDVYKKDINMACLIFSATIVYNTPNLDFSVVNGQIVSIGSHKRFTKLKLINQLSNIIILYFEDIDASSCKT